MPDRRILLATAFLRAAATGLAGVLLGLHLASLLLSAETIGTTVAAGLVGGAGATLFATFAADRCGRRLSLALLALLTAGGGAALALLGAHPLALAAVAFVGMVNGSGRDRGASLVLEQAILPSTVPDSGRTRAFAWYNALQDAGHALGSLAAGLAGVVGFSSLWGLYAALSLVSLALYAGLSPQVEARAPRALPPLDPATRRNLTKISALFALDSLGGGFLTAALVSYFFRERFHVDAAALGLLYFAARTANALSHFAASWLASRIGLVNTMVFTHVPSSLLLLTVAFAPTFPVAAILFLLREGLVEMDVPTRQSYVMALVPPEHRTRASGITHLVRLAGWAAAPSIAGVLMGSVSLMTPLAIGAGLKLTYDFALYVSFRRVRPPEEN